MTDLWKPEEQVMFSLRDLYQRYGYTQFKMSKFEPYDLYMRNKEFLVSEGVITFTDTDGTLMALKPDVTLSIVKNYRNAPLQKVCYSENVYRIAGASKSYREIMQTGLECMGEVGTYEISEVILLALRSLQTVTPKFMLDLSHMDILDDILAATDLTNAQAEDARGLIADKNEDALIALCSSLPNSQTETLIRLLRISGTMEEAIPVLEQLTNSPAITDLKQLSAVLSQQGFAQRVCLDFSIISDRHYYNGFVFRGYAEGIPESILSGGQYDLLMKKMGKKAKGIGFAVYLDQLELLHHRSKSYDIDTVLLYTASDDLQQLNTFAQPLSETGVLLLKEKPQNIRYRRLMCIRNGRLEELENHG